MKVILLRYFSDDYCTLGMLSVQGVKDPILYTMERPWLNNEQEKSCIPSSVYKVKPYSSDKYPNVWEIQNVPNRSKILIHAANYVHELKGCIAVGRSTGYLDYKGAPLRAISSSKDAIQVLKELTNYPDEFELEII